MSEFNYKKYLKEGRLLREETKARKLGITDFPYIEKDKNGNITYRENEYGFFEKFEYFPDNRLKGKSSGYGSHYPKINSYKSPSDFISLFNPFFLKFIATSPA